MPIEIRVPANCFAFKFLQKTIVIYHNDKRKNTFGKDSARIASYSLKYTDGKILESEGDSLDTPIAGDIRKGLVEKMDIFLH